MQLNIEENTDWTGSYTLETRKVIPLFIKLLCGLFVEKKKVRNN